MDSTIVNNAITHAEHIEYLKRLYMSRGSAAIPDLKPRMQRIARGHSVLAYNDNNAEEISRIKKNPLETSLGVLTVSTSLGSIGALAFKKPMLAPGLLATAAGSHFGNKYYSLNNPESQRNRRVRAHKTLVADFSKRFNSHVKHEYDRNPRLTDVFPAFKKELATTKDLTSMYPQLTGRFQAALLEKHIKNNGIQLRPFYLNQKTQTMDTN